MPRRGADILVDTLVEADIPYLFTLSGNQILSVFDATIERDIELIHTRHEATAVHMADGWGRLTGQPGVALLTAGPGHCNGIGALYTARMAESPLLLLSGSSPAGKAGLGAFQDIDQIGIASPVCKAAWQLENAGEVGNEINRALEISRSGRPGPVHLSLPQDLLEETVTGAAPAALQSPEGRLIDANRVNQTLEALSSAQRPLILCGPAMSRNERWEEVCALSRLTSVPALPMESPRGINDPWLRGATNCLERADLVLLLGKRFDFTLGTTAAPVFDSNCRLVQIDADALELRAHESVVSSFEADPLAAARMLTAGAAGRSWNGSGWREEIEGGRAALPEAWQELGSNGELPMHPLAICEALRGWLDDDAVFVCDGGEVGQWMQAGLDAKYRLINGPAGAIGSSIGLGLAAQLAYPEKRVFVLCGDGTAGYHLLDLDTAVRRELAVIVLVGNDRRWNAEHQLQLKQYGNDRLVGCELLGTRYDEVAAALGAHGEFVQHPDELRPGLERALDSGLPACINVAIEGVGAPTFR